MATNSYIQNMPAQASLAVCSPPNNYYDDANLMRVFSRGVANENLTPDPVSGRIPVSMLATHVQKLVSSGVIPRRPTQNLASTQETDMDKLVQVDTEFFERLQREYCHYEQRYRYALKAFLLKATSRVSADNALAQSLLAKTKILNLRLNSVLEVMNYLAQSRVTEVNSNKEAINNYNKNINNKLQQLKASYDYLNKENVIVNTQRESVRYTEEKNNYTSSQVGMWAALNVVALATIFYVYRN
jgi:hypothetical protein